MERTYWRGVAWTYQGGQKQVSHEGDSDDDDNHYYILDQMDSLSSIFDGGRQYVALFQAWKPSVGHEDSDVSIVDWCTTLVIMT